MGRSPGIDGLTAEFYKHIWVIIEKDFYEVVLEFFINKLLPISCRRAVLSLLPKKERFRIFKKLEACVFIMFGL